MVVDIEVLSMAVVLVSTAGLRRQTAMEAAASVVTCFELRTDRMWTS